MKLPDWTKPALMGAAAGAIALSIVGFGLGGWVTSGGAADIARKQSVAAIAEALTPYCLQSAKADGNAPAVLNELSAAPAFNQRTIVEKAGWATPLGKDAPNRELAQACLLALLATP